MPSSSGRPSKSVLLIDLDGTLVDLRVPKAVFYARLFGTLAIRLRQVIRLRDAIGLVRAVSSSLFNNTSSLTLLGSLQANLKIECGVDERVTEAVLEAWVNEDFPAFRPWFSPIVGATEWIEQRVSEGCRLILASNPVVPKKSMEMRLKWAGIDPTVFEHYTHIANSTRCKPSPEYYQELLRAIQVSAEECIMVGNDPVMDGAARKIGIATFVIDQGNLPRTWSYWRDAE